jgi:hypothetical protein
MEASMSLSRARLVYGCGVAIIAALLISAGSPIYLYAAAILIVVAPLLLRAIERASWQETIDKSEYTIDAILADSDQIGGRQYRP